MWRRKLKQRHGYPQLVVCCAVALVLLGCDRTRTTPASVTIEPVVTPQPARLGPATISFKLSDASGSLVSGAQARIEANMTHAGMTPVFADAKEVSRGMYQCPIEFSMAGDWVITAHITLSDGQKLERQFEVRGVRSD